MKEIKQFIQTNFHIIKTRNRFNDELLELKCPLCGDNKKHDRKNRARAAFICKEDSIFYHCFNCNKSLSISERMTDLAFVLSREKDISYQAAKQVLSPLLKHFLTVKSIQEQIIDVPDIIKEIKIKGNVPQKSGVKWLNSRGFTPTSMLQFRQIDSKKLILPFMQHGKCFGYQEIDIEKKFYKNITETNNLNHYLIGIDDINPATERVLVVESAIDAKLITQDSDSIVVGLALAGLSLGKQRKQILESLSFPFILFPDNDESGLQLLDGLKGSNPQWLASLTPKPFKDYGEYRKNVGPIIALSRLVQQAKQLNSVALKLLRL